MASKGWAANMTVTEVDDNAVWTCRRPVSPGFFDSSSNTTFFCWSGTNMEGYVKSYDHVSGEFSPSIRLPSRVPNDYHNYPHMIKTDDGRIMVVWSEHNELLLRALSEGPLSLAGTWDIDEIREGYEATYPMPVKADNGDIYIFYRQSFGIDDKPERYVKSTDNGTTWNAAVDAIKHTDLRPDNLNEMYLGTAKHESALGGRPEKIHISWNIAGGGPEGPKHDMYHKNIYHAYLNLTNDHFYNVAGVDLGTTINNNQSVNHCLAVDSGPLTFKRDGDTRTYDIGYISSVSYSDSGNPILVYSHLLPEDSVEHARSVRWTGESWKVTDTGHATTGVKELEKIGPKSFRLYIGVAGGKIQVLNTSDSGASWSNDDLIDETLSIRDFVLIDDHHPEIRAVMSESTNEYSGIHKVWVAGHRS